MDLHISRAGIVVPVRADPAGITGPTPDQARGRGWRTTSPGRFVPAHLVDVSTEQRIVEAAAGLPPGAAVTGWAALHWSGTRWFDGRSADGTELPIPVAIDDARHLAQRSGVAASADWLFDDDIVWIDGLPVTRTERTVSFAARRARSDEAAMQIIDMAAAGDQVELAGLRAYVGRLPSRPGIRRLRRALDQADENAWSPMEVTMRRLWTDRDHRRPLCNRPIFDLNENHLLTPDLFDPIAGVVGEYDGAIHSTTTVRRRDLNREEICRQIGLEMVTMMSTDLRDTTAFLWRLDNAYRRAENRPLMTNWTLELPSWWIDTSTVAKRRALDASQRLRWLRRQAG